jgi:hypothetical protein
LDLKAKKGIFKVSVPSFINLGTEKSGITKVRSHYRQDEWVGVRYCLARPLHWFLLVNESKALLEDQPLSSDVSDHTKMFPCKKPKTPAKTIPTWIRLLSFNLGSTLRILRANTTHWQM